MVPSKNLVRFKGIAIRFNQIYINLFFVFLFFVQIEYERYKKLSQKGIQKHEIIIIKCGARKKNKHLNREI